MTLRSWLTGLFAGVKGRTPARPRWGAALGCDALPERDSPSTLDIGQVVLFSAGPSGERPRPSRTLTDTFPTSADPAALSSWSVPVDPPPLPASAVAAFPSAQGTVRRDHPDQGFWGVDLAEPPAAFGKIDLEKNPALFPPVSGSQVDAERNAAPHSFSPTDARPPEPPLEPPASKSVSIPPPARPPVTAEPETPAEPEPPASDKNSRPRPAAPPNAGEPPPAPATTVTSGGTTTTAASLPTPAAQQSPFVVPTVPAVTPTPVEPAPSPPPAPTPTVPPEPTPTVAVVVPANAVISLPQVPASTPAPPQDEASPRPPADTPNVTVSGERTPAVQPVGPATPVFRIAGTAIAEETLTVSYTLAGHDSGGTVSVTGTVTLTSASPVVFVSAGPVLGTRPPDVLTLTLREGPGVRPARASATVFLRPRQHIGDVALIEAHRVGRSAEAFDTLAGRHDARVTRLCQRILRNRADAEDVRQVVFLTLAGSRSRFSGSVAAWLRTVSRNASLGFLRAKRRRVRHEAGAAKAVAVGPSPAAGLDDAVAAALQQLPAVLMEAVRLRYLDGYTQDEAARIADCPRGTLSRRAAAGIQRLRELLGEGHSGAS